MNAKILLTGMLLAASVTLMGLMPGDNHRSPKDIMKCYRGEKGFVSFSVPALLVRVFVTEEDQEVRDMLRNIRSIRILACEEAERNPRLVDACIHDFRTFFRESRYVSLLEISDRHDHIELKALPGDHGFYDLILIARDDHDFAVIHFKGFFDMEKIGKLIEEKEIATLSSR